MNLTREADLAAEWGYSPEQFRVLRRRHQWARVEMSRQDIRYTDEQIALIVQQLTVVGEKPSADRQTGQTARSIARSA